jgi:hypothetical protein
MIDRSVLFLFYLPYPSAFGIAVTRNDLHLEIGQRSPFLLRRELLSKKGTPIRCPLPDRCTISVVQLKLYFTPASIFLLFFHDPRSQG